MQPDQQPAPDYSFLDDAGKSPKRSLLGGFLSGGDNKQNKLMMIAGGGVVLVVILGIIALLFGGNGGNSDQLVGIVAQQNELIRVSELGDKDATSAETKNFASTVNLSLITAEAQLSAHVSKQGTKLKPADKNAAKDSKTDTALTTASQVNRFDEVFNQTLKTALEKYQQSLKSAFESSGSQSEKVLLQDLYNKATVLASSVPSS